MRAKVIMCHLSDLFAQMATLQHGGECRKDDRGGGQAMTMELFRKWKVKTHLSVPSTHRNNNNINNSNWRNCVAAGCCQITPPQNRWHSSISKENPQHKYKNEKGHLCIPTGATVIKISPEIKCCPVTNAGGGWMVGDGGRWKWRSGLKRPSGNWNCAINYDTIGLINKNEMEHYFQSRCLLFFSPECGGAKIRGCVEGGVFNIKDIPKN